MPPKKIKKTQEDPEELQEEEKKNQNPGKKLVQTIKAPIKSDKNYEGVLSSPLGNGKFGQNKVILASWNINGIRAVMKKGDLVNYMKSKSPDVLCLNEIKIDHSMFDKEQDLAAQFPKEYHQYWNFCKPPNKGYAGTAIFSKVAPISVQYDIGIKEHDQEGRTTTLEFEKFFIVACYVPNAGQKLERLGYRTKKWDADFQNFLNELKKKKTTILCGDLNVAHHEIDLANPKGNLKTAGFTVEEREQFTKYLNQGWVDSFRKKYPKTVKYSYFSARTGAREKNTGWRLDYFVIDDKSYNAVDDSTINNDIYGSDHTPIELNLDLQKL